MPTLTPTATASIPCAVRMQVGQHFNRYTLRYPEVLVLHWTAGAGDVHSLFRYLDTTKGDGGYQYAIDDAGTIAEYMDPSHVAWHAGDGNAWDPRTLCLDIAADDSGPPQRWQMPTIAIKGVGNGPGLALAHVSNSPGLVRMNHASIGIGLCNRGPMAASRGGLPGTYDRPGFAWTHFDPYSDKLRASLDRLVVALAARFPSLRFVCGHQDITKGKGDPGPLLAEWVPPAETHLARIHYDWKRKTWELSHAQVSAWKVAQHKAVAERRLVRTVSVGDRDYEVVLAEGEDGWLVVSCLAIEGCVSQGRDVPQALDNIREAIALCLLDADEALQREADKRAALCNEFVPQVVGLDALPPELQAYERERIAREAAQRAEVVAAHARIEAAEHAAVVEARGPDPDADTSNGDEDRGGDL